MLGLRIISTVIPSGTFSRRTFMGYLQICKVFINISLNIVKFTTILRKLSEIYLSVTYTTLYNYKQNHLYRFIVKIGLRVSPLKASSIVHGHIYSLLYCYASGVSVDSGATGDSSAVAGACCTCKQKR
jgi:hypothetical protein